MSNIMMTEMTFCLKEILYTVPLTCLFVFNAMKVDCLCFTAKLNPSNSVLLLVSEEKKPNKISKKSFCSFLH